MNADRMNLEVLPPEVRDRVRSFLGEILEKLGKHVESFTVSGKAALQNNDFCPETIDSILVCDRISVHYVEDLAPLGKKHGERGIRSPFLMSGDFLRESLDIFPLEFLNIQLAHKTVYGEDPFPGLVIAKKALRQQCVRDLESFLFRFRQGYLSSRGEALLLEKVVQDASENFFSLVRGVLFLLDAKIQNVEADDVKMLSEKLSLSRAPVTSTQLLETLKKQPKMNFEALHAFAEEFCLRMNDQAVEG